MADVIALPGAALQPPPQARRRGRYPREVVSLARARRAHAARFADPNRSDKEEQELASPRSLRKLLAAVGALASDGKLAGFAIVLDTGEADLPRVCTAGTLRSDRGFEVVRDALATLEDALADGR
jgi:hypothetical protein